MYLSDKRRFKDMDIITGAQEDTSLELGKRIWEENLGAKVVYFLFKKLNYCIIWKTLL